MADLPLPPVVPCKSCKLPVRWVETSGGKNMPMDAKPDTLKGNYVLLRRAAADGHVAGPWIARYVGDSWRMFPEEERYTSHFATCKHASSWRRAG